MTKKSSPKSTTRSLDQAAEQLGIPVYSLLRIINIGEVKPKLLDPDQNIWAMDADIRFTDEDLIRFQAEVDRRNFKALRNEYHDLIEDGAELRFGPGWTKMIADALSAVREKTTPGQFRFHYGKEKFGNIQFSYGCRDEVREIVREIMRPLRKLSLATCEECGNPGRLRIGHSIAKTTCEAHARLVGDLRPEDGLYLDVQDWVNARRLAGEIGNDNTR